MVTSNWPPSPVLVCSSALVASSQATCEHRLLRSELSQVRTVKATSPPVPQALCWPPLLLRSPGQQSTSNARDHGHAMSCGLGSVPFVTA